MYKFKQNIRIRNICGVYFLIDIADKKLSINRKLISFNEIAAVIIQIADEQQNFNCRTIHEILIKKLIDVTDDLNVQIMKDVEEFLRDLFIKGYVEEMYSLNS